MSEKYRPYSDSITQSTIIRCPFEGCNARVIKRGNLPEVKVVKAPQMVKINESSTNTYFLQVNDVWDFDNIGVSKPTDTLDEPQISFNGSEIEITIQRLLICSECDKGPLGFAGIKKDHENHHSNLVYFLSRDSMRYE